MVPNSRLMVQCREEDDAKAVLVACYTKMMDYNPHLMRVLSDSVLDYRLIYRSGVEVTLIPGTCLPFSLKGYKDGIGLPYQSLYFGLRYG